MEKIIGFIGCGNMGSAMLKGIVESRIVPDENIYVADHNMNKLKEIEKERKIHITTDNKQVAQMADILILAVKPNFYEDVIGEIKNSVRKETVIVSIAAGKTIQTIESLFEKKNKLRRVMPNTPAMVGEAMSALAPNCSIEQKELEEVQTIFNSFGKCEVVTENLMDAVTAVSGSSPAYIFMLIEAMADEAVLEGMPRKQAYTFAAQAVLGSAKMVLETEKHPGDLKDMVCSPGGTTIEAVYELEKTGLRTSIMQAMRKCSDKSKEMSK